MLSDDGPEGFVAGAQPPGWRHALQEGGVDRRVVGDLPVLALESYVRERAPSPRPAALPVAPLVRLCGC